MKKVFLAIALSTTLFAAPAMARDSTRDSGASVAVASLVPASLVVVSAYVGSEMVIESVRVVGDVLEIVLKGVGTASRAVLTLTADSAKATGVAAGQSVKVVAQGGGYLLVASGKALCFVPGAADESLFRSARSQ